MESTIKVAVIGAGPAGLCCGRYLVTDPEVFEFDIFEQQNDAGGTWKYSDRVGLDENGLPVHSSMYESLRLHVPKEVMAFPDFPFPDYNGRSFLHHSEIFQYLKDYAQHFNLYKHIKFRTLVENVKPLKYGEDQVQWLITYFDLVTKEKQIKTYDAVIVCNGRYTVPHIPEIPGLKDFQGILMHSHEYREPTVFKDLKVVILGAGASGIDIGDEISSLAKEVIISHNLPLLQYKFTENMSQEKGIKLVNESTVTFMDGRTYRCDAILLCTGYLYHYPFLDPECGVQVSDHRISNLYLHTFLIDHPTLAILFVPKMILTFKIFSQQVKVFLKVLKGVIQLPSKEVMKAEECKDFKRRLEMGWHSCHAHLMSGDLQWEFDDALCQLGQMEPIPHSVRKLLVHVRQLRAKYMVSYKNNNYKLIDDDSFVQIE